MKTENAADRPSMDERLNSEIMDSFEEELEMELDDVRLDQLLPEFTATSDESHDQQSQTDSLSDRQMYFKELFRLQGELVKLQDWVVRKKLKVVVLFEGRDAAGKGGEIVLFDRSWYNRAGVEKVMGFCTDEEYEEFFRSVPAFEKMLVRSGIILIKYWFSITDNEQHLRFMSRIHDPLKQWKLSPMDLESRRLWEQYTKAKEVMLERTHIPEAPWWVVEAVDKKKARLNCISHLLSQIEYGEVDHTPVVLPKRVYNADYIRGPVPKEMFVPAKY